MSGTIVTTKTPFFQTATGKFIIHIGVIAASAAVLAVLKDPSVIKFLTGLGIPLAVANYIENLLAADIANW